MTSTDVDEEYTDGVVPNGFDVPDLEGWYGFVVTSTPETRGSCDALSAD